MPKDPIPKKHPYDQHAGDAAALDLIGDKWTLLIIRDLLPGPVRFVELQRLLPGISTEQLRSRLNRMVADGLLQRTRYREVPPRVEYELVSRTRELMPVIGALTQWGLAWAIRPQQQFNVGAYFRSMFATCSSSGWNLPGSVQIEVAGNHPDEPVFQMMFGKLIMWGEENKVEVVIRGSKQQWRRALMAGKLTGLVVSGEIDTAQAMITAFRMPQPSA